MFSRFLLVAAAGVLASNSTNSTTSAPATTPVPDVTCNATTQPAGYLVPGAMPAECCANQLTIVTYGIFTDSTKAGLRPLIPECLATTTPTGGGCVNVTAGDFTPNAISNGHAGYEICVDAPCVTDWISGLYANTATLNGQLIAGSNYTRFCGEDLPAAFDTAIAGYNAIGNGTVTGTPYTGTQMAGVFTGKKAAVAANFAAVVAAEAAARAAGEAAIAAAAATTTGAPSSDSTTAAPSSDSTTAAPSSSSSTSAPAQSSSNGSSSSASTTATITASLTVGITVPANTTVASLNSDTAFETALAASIKASLTAASAVVTVTSVSAASSRRALKAARRLATLDLTIDYTVELPQADATAVFDQIKDNGDTFAASVKTNSAAEFTSGGLTGFAVDTVTAAAPTITNGPATTAAPSDVLDDAASSGAVARVAGLSVAALALAPLF